MSMLAADWVDRAFPYYELIRILNFYLDLECWIISLDRPAPWNPIRYHNRDSWPVELDDLFGRREARGKYNQLQIKKVVQTKKIVCAAFDGFYSFFVPILKKGKMIGVFQCGLFIKNVPTRPELALWWKRLAGTEIPRFDADFSRFVRTVLETPIVEGPVYGALRELLELFAAVAAGEADPQNACRTAERMKVEIFSRHLPNRYWMEKAVKNNRHYPPDWWVEKARADQWRKEEQGIERSPRVVLAVMPDGGPRSSPDDLDIILRNRRFQKEFFEFSKKIPHTISSPLEDYGMVFFTSVEPGTGEVKAKLEILDRIDKLSQVSYERLGIRLLTGVGRCLGSEENLSRIYREAVLALEFCRPLSRPILFYEDLHHNPSVPQFPLFYDLSKKLVEVYLSGAVREIEPVRSRYIEEVLAHSAGRAETVRLHFLFVCGQLIDALGHKKPLREQDFSKLFGALENQFRETADLPDLIGVFREALKQFLELNLRPELASRATQIEEASRYVDRNFTENLKIAAVAKLHGFSLSVFAREFKLRTGVGFAAYLKKVRVKHARHLLVSTQLPVARISQESGFNNIHYFFDVYKRETGQTPGEFRQKSESKK